MDHAFVYPTQAEQSVSRYVGLLLSPCISFFSTSRAISVLLGEAWKGLPPEEREQYSQRAKVMADEQKKLYPDCWKRKRTVNNANGSGRGQQAQPPPEVNLPHPTTLLPPPPPLQPPPVTSVAAPPQPGQPNIKTEDK